MIENPCDDRVDFLVTQRPVSMLHPDPEGKAFLLIFQPLTAILVKQVDVLDAGQGRVPGCQAADFLEDPAGRHLLVEHHGEVADGRREAADLLVGRNIRLLQRAPVQLGQQDRARQIQLVDQPGVQRTDPADGIVNCLKKEKML